MEGTWAPCFFLAPFFCSPSFSPPFSLSLLTRSCHNSFDLSHSLSSCLHPSFSSPVTEVEAAMMKTTTMTGLEGGGSITATIGRGGSIVLGLGRGDDDGERWQRSSRVADRAPHPSGVVDPSPSALGEVTTAASNDGEPRSRWIWNCRPWEGRIHRPWTREGRRRLRRQSQGEWEARVSAEFFFWFYLPKIFLVDWLKHPHAKIQFSQTPGYT